MGPNIELQYFRKKKKGKKIAVHRLKILNNWTKIYLTD